MDEVFRTLHLELMSGFFQAARRLGIGKVLPGKEQHHVALFVADGIAVAEGVLDYRPSHVDAGSFIDPCAGLVKRFVADGFEHALQLWLRPRAGLFGDEAYDAWHIR